MAPGEGAVSHRPSGRYMNLRHQHLTRAALYSLFSYGPSQPLFHLNFNTTPGDGQGLQQPPFFPAEGTRAERKTERLWAAEHGRELAAGRL